MAETVFALTDAAGVVLNLIVAEQDFIDNLAEQLADPDVDTGVPDFHKAYDVTGQEVGIGWTVKNKKFSEPVPPKPTPEEIAAQQAAVLAAQQAVDDETFRTAMKDKLRAGKSLTQDERDRLLALSA